MRARRHPYWYDAMGHPAIDSEGLYQIRIDSWIMKYGKDAALRVWDLRAGKLYCLQDTFGDHTKIMQDWGTYTTYKAPALTSTVTVHNERMYFSSEAAPLTLAELQQVRNLWMRARKIRPTKRMRREFREEMRQAINSIENLLTKVEAYLKSPKTEPITQSEMCA